MTKWTLFRTVSSICLLLWSVGCFDDSPIRDGFPCRNGEDCKGLFCKDSLCVREPCEKEGAQRPCYFAKEGCPLDTNSNCQGTCKRGNQVCSGGFWGACEGQIAPLPETCNNKDDDCNGQVDDLPQSQENICDHPSLEAIAGFRGCKKGKTICDTSSEVIIKADQRNNGFRIGSPKTSLGRNDDEVQVTVTFNYRYSITTREVTQQLFQQIVGYNPSDTKGEALPVTNVSWHEAAYFANQLSIQRKRTPCFKCDPGTQGKRYNGRCEPASPLDEEASYVNCTGYRLPTETEWEVAYRGGNGDVYRDFFNGNLKEAPDKCHEDKSLNEIGWYCHNSQDRKPQKVAQKKPNAWGIFDLSGNVAEWVYDLYEKTYSKPFSDRTGPTKTTSGERVVRGGHVNARPVSCRGAGRNKFAPTLRNKFVGFRLARTISTPEPPRKP